MTEHPSAKPAPLFIALNSVACGLHNGGQRQGPLVGLVACMQNCSPKSLKVTVRFKKDTSTGLLHIPPLQYIDIALALLNRRPWQTSCTIHRTPPTRGRRWKTTVSDRAGTIRGLTLPQRRQKTYCTIPDTGSRKATRSKPPKAKSSWTPYTAIRWGSPTRPEICQQNPRQQQSVPCTISYSNPKPGQSQRSSLWQRSRAYMLALSWWKESVYKLV